jgi:excisionase family DNA binding protein
MGCGRLLKEDLMIEIRIGQLAKKFGVHRNTVLNWIKSGKLEAVPTVGKKYLVKEDVFYAFCRNNGIEIMPLDQFTQSGQPLQSAARQVIPKINARKREVSMSEKSIGSVMVVGGGIAGIQATLDLADSGYFVHLIEKTAGIGGVMAQLDKTYPTNDCAM